MKLERSSSTCRHARRVEVAVPTLLKNPHSVGSEETEAPPAAKFPSGDHATVSGPRRRQYWLALSQVEDRSALPWRLVEECTSPLRCLSASSVSDALYRGPRKYRPTISRTFSPSFIPKLGRRSVQ